MSTEFGAIRDLFGIDIDIKEGLRKMLAGKTFELKGATISFPENLSVLTTLDNGNILFNPPATVTRQGLIKVSAKVTGVTVSLTKITLLLNGFPDIPINLNWR